MAVAIDLYSRRVVDRAMQSRQTTDVVLTALLMAAWRRKPENRVLIHPDQGSKITSMDWAAFLRAHDLENSMSLRGNCHDNAVAESFFNLRNRDGYGVEPKRPASRPDRMGSTTSRCSETLHASM